MLVPNKKNVTICAKVVGIVLPFFDFKLVDLKDLHELSVPTKGAFTQSLLRGKICGRLGHLSNKIFFSVNKRPSCERSLSVF